MARAEVSQKLYCYVDETGQDTLGRLFVVVAVVASSEHQDLGEFLHRAERQSGGRRSHEVWSKSNRKRLDKYLTMALQPGPLTGKIFYQVFADSKEYDRLTAETAVRALQRYAADQSIAHFKATIIIDGLTRGATRNARKIVLKSRIRIDKIRAQRDDSNPFLRLANAVTLPVRKALERDWPSRALIQKAKKDGVFTELH